METEIEVLLQWEKYETIYIGEALGHTYMIKSNVKDVLGRRIFITEYMLRHKNNIVIDEEAITLSEAKNIAQQSFQHTMKKEAEAKAERVRKEEEALTVKGIMNQHLIDLGYDGLYSDECGCHVGDLMPCNDYSGHCKVGYKKAAPECSGVDWIIGPE